MATETKKISIEWGKEPYYTNKVEMFGWKLISEKTTHKFGEMKFTGTAEYQMKCGAYYDREMFTFDEYIFERDTTMRNYEKIVALEDEYFSIYHMIVPRKPNYDELSLNGVIITITILLGILPTLYSLFFSKSNSQEFYYFLIPGLCITGIGLIYVIIKIIVQGVKKNRYKKALSQYEILDKKYTQKQKRLDIISKEVKELMS